MDEPASSAFPAEGNAPAPIERVPTAEVPKGAPKETDDLPRLNEKALDRYIDVLKHMTTLASGIIAVEVAFGQNSHSRVSRGSVIAFSFCIGLSLVGMAAMAEEGQSRSKNMDSGTKLALRVMFNLSLAAFMCGVGIMIADAQFS